MWFCQSVIERSDSVGGLLGVNATKWDCDSLLDSQLPVSTVASSKSTLPFHLAEELYFERHAASCGSGRLAVQMAFHCHRSVLRCYRGASLYVTDTPVVDLPKEGNDLGHFAPFLPYRLAMHLKE